MFSLRILFLFTTASVYLTAQSVADLQKMMTEAEQASSKEEHDAALAKLEQAAGLAEKLKLGQEDLLAIYMSAAMEGSRSTEPAAARKAIVFIDKALPIARKLGKQGEVQMLNAMRISQSMLAGVAPGVAAGDVPAGLAGLQALAQVAASGDYAATQKAVAAMAMSAPGAGTQIGADSYLSTGDLAGARPYILQMEKDTMSTWNASFGTMGASAESLGMANGWDPRGNSLAVVADLLLYPNDAEIHRNAMQVLLSRKNSAFGSGSRVMAALRRNPTTEAKALRQQLATEYAKIGRLWGRAALSGQRLAAESLKPAMQAAARLEQQAQDWEFAATASPTPPLGPRVADVAAALPKDAALVEFARIDWLDYRGLKNATMEQRKAMRFEQHYVAYTLLADGTIRGHSLGSAAVIDKELHDLRARMGPKLPPLELRRVAQRLYGLVWKPIEASLAGRTRVYLSPDSQLALLPFDVLMNAQGQYLIETHLLSYLFSGTQLATPAATSRSQVPVAVLAAADFAQPGGAERAQSLQQRFGLLRHTALEAQAIERIVPGAKLYVESQAAEATLKSLPPARILHLATHGYYVEVEAPPPPANVAAGSVMVATWSPFRPMRSGLVLREAGRGAVGEDGLVTAMEISALDLSATQLVVLSACDSGVGEPLTGGSVSGLRNAFQLAGAQALVASLWKVDDAAGKELMEGFYDGLADGKATGTALREAKLAMLKSARSHPYFWAPFALEGRDQVIRF